jgi:hypothetical protein
MSTFTVQLGVCPVWRSSNDPEYQERTGSLGDPDVWCLAPYNFNIFPNSVKTLHFLSFTKKKPSI